MAEEFVIDDKTSEGSGSSNIIIRDLKDFIQDDCEVTKFELSPDEKYIDVEVVNPAGKRASKRLYLPKDKSEYQGNDKKTPEQQYESAKDTFFKSLANFVRRYKGKDYKVSGRSFVEITKAIQTAATPLLSSKKVRVLLELRKSDKGIFTNIGSFSPFEDMDTVTSFRINDTQKNLLAEKNAYKPDSDGVEMTETATAPVDTAEMF